MDLLFCVALLSQAEVRRALLSADARKPGLFEVLELHTASQRVRRASDAERQPADNRGMDINTAPMMIGFVLLAVGFIVIGLLGGWEPRNDRF